LAGFTLGKELVPSVGTPPMTDLSIDHTSHQRAASRSGALQCLRGRSGRSPSKAVR